jgi:isoamylase
MATKSALKAIDPVVRDPLLGWRMAPGTPHPPGATVLDGGVNFSLFSQNASSVTLLLFKNHDDAVPVASFELDRDNHRTFHFWHCFVGSVEPGMFYGFQVDGPPTMENGHRFNPAKVLIDPYGKGVSKTLWKRDSAIGPEGNLATSLRSAIIDLAGYDWEGDAHPRTPMAETVVYEMHVGGFTRDASSGVVSPGSFRAVIEKIPYLKKLGVTAVELLPVFDYDNTDYREVDGQTLANYWGYSPLAFFSPHSGYCATPHEASHADEFRDMVKALHKAGIEVFLDVVFNHTDEGDDNGPTTSFRGIDNATFYMLSPADQRHYADYSGCGNSIDANHPVVAKFIVDVLKYWVNEMHVDGFRFDEASVLSRGPDGAPLPYPTVLWQIELEESLADAKVIAEAWDAAGLYQVGHFPGYRWAEWNGRFRDDMRRFVRGEPGMIGSVAARLSGSSDLYESSGHLPVNSVNFITAHDGFTLNDLVSYNVKHNEANGEHNRDGVDDNMSWNCGVEGPTDAPDIEALRERQIRNFACLLLLAQGIPMFVMGDEVRRSQSGNNNAYCQDNAVSWFDWSAVDRHAGMRRFFAEMIAFRRRHSTIHRSRFLNGQLNERGMADVTWHGVELGAPNWDDPGARVLAYTMAGFGDAPDLHVMINMYWEKLSMAIPDVDGRGWYRAIDTTLSSPDNIADAGSETPVQGGRYAVGPRSVVVLISR